MKITLNPFKTDFPRLMPLWIAVFVDILGFSILIPFLPFFGQRFGAPAWQIGLLLSTNALFSFFSGPIWGSLSDRYGRKRMLLLAQLGTLVGFLVMAFSTSLEMMFVSRIIDGIFGGIYPIAKAVVADVVPPSKRSEQMSNIGVAHVLSSMLGPGLGGLLSGWGIVGPGLMAAAMVTVAILMTIFRLEESNPPASAHSRGGSRVVPTAVPGGGGAAFARSVNGRRGVWQNGLARFLLVQWGFHTLSFMIFMSSISLFGNLKLGLNAGEMGRLLMMAGIVRVFVRFAIFVPLRRRLGDQRTSQLGLAMFVPTYLLLGLVTNQLQFALILTLVSFGAACSRGILNSFLSRSVKRSEQGAAMGLSASLDSFAQITGPLIGGFVLDSQPLWVYGGIAALFSMGAFAMAWRRFDLGDEAVPVAV
ncbi:MAG: MFS transporter [Anaerolineae bacterium]|nr:MFS transporter [Anaerolineae bacterium]